MSDVFSQGVRDSDHTSSMPPEVLSTILVLAKGNTGPDEDDDTDTGAKEVLPIELVVSHVSAYWRSVAIGTRQLWRYIVVRPSQSVEKLCAYLENSAPYPLHIWLDLTQNPLDVEAVTEKLDHLFLHLGRWARFTIHSSIERSEIPVVSRMYDVSAPFLEHLGLCINDIDSENLKSIRRTDLEQILTLGCPRLSVLRLRGLSMHFFRPPLTSITTLYLEQTRGLFIGFQRFSDLLTASPALAHLSIHDAIIDDVVDTWPFEYRIPLPNLISLRISFPGVQPIFSEVLVSIVAPQLESLVLKEVGETHLDRFFGTPECSGKFPRLRKLTFCDFDYRSDERVDAICAALPSITELTCIHSTAHPLKILQMMAGLRTNFAGATTDVPWPHLHTFSTTLDIEDFALVRDAMELRKKVGCPLRLLRLSGVLDELDEDDEDDLEWLQENMTVEKFSAVDRWPPGSEYDPDDNLFV
ncbi:hypothetical protein B0H10DRAFT_1946493 [Mycena sp. CBHHK59/15]|nr:hypothetical protein B0H10DRAFT_1946493 [Mycena sp. CBHHK59/15]